MELLLLDSDRWIAYRLQTDAIARCEWKNGSCAFSVADKQRWTKAGAAPGIPDASGIGQVLLVWHTS